MSVHKYIQTKQKLNSYGDMSLQYHQMTLINSAIQSENNLLNGALAPKRKPKLLKEKF